MNARLLLVHALSPLHAGTGQGVGVIDLPIAREKATGLPYLPGSSLKGVLRDACDVPTLRTQVFGPDTANASEHAGSVQISDQRLLLLPIRCLSGTFAWVTSPYILRRLLRDVQGTGIDGLPSVIPSPTQSAGVVCEQACQIVRRDEHQRQHHHAVVCEQACQIVADDRVVLEDLDLIPTQDKAADAWANWLGEQIFPGDTDWQQMLIGRFCVVHDDILSFLLDTATEITARIKLQEDSKTVQKGGLWYEEALPTETVLYGLVVATPVKADPPTVFMTINSLIQKPLQLGGKATVGHGLCHLQMIGGE